jgi:hypothetical protein
MTPWPWGRYTARRLKSCDVLGADRADDANHGRESKRDRRFAGYFARRHRLAVSNISPPMLALAHDGLYKRRRGRSPRP